MSFIDSIIAFLQNGGSFIYPIALVLVVGLAITIERWLYLSSTLRTNQKAFALLQSALKKGDINAISEQAKNGSAPVLDVLTSGISRLSTVKRREDVEYAMEETIMEYMLRLE